MEQQQGVVPSTSPTFAPAQVVNARVSDVEL